MWILVIILASIGPWTGDTSAAEPLSQAVMIPTEPIG